MSLDASGEQRSAANDLISMKAYGSNPLGRRLTSLKQELCDIQEERQRVEANPSLEGINRMGAATKCAVGSL